MPNRTGNSTPNEPTNICHPLNTAATSAATITIRNGFNRSDNQPVASPARSPATLPQAFKAPLHSETPSSEPWMSCTSSGRNARSNWRTKAMAPIIASTPYNVADSDRHRTCSAAASASAGGSRAAAGARVSRVQHSTSKPASSSRTPDTANAAR